MEQNILNIIYKSKKYQIPSNFQNLDNINPEIFKILTKEGEYKVKSDISENTFELFINYWINNQIPNFNFDNISEFEKLSQEFDLMKGIIKIYKQKMSNKQISPILYKTQKLRSIISLKRDMLNKKCQNYQNIINILFNSKLFNSYLKFLRIKDKLYDRCINDDFQYIYLQTRKKVINNNITYILNEHEKTAIIYFQKKLFDDIFIPKSIIVDSNEYIVTEISYNAFKNCRKIKSIQFPSDSLLQIINEKAFDRSSIETLTIPPSLSELKEGWCAQVEKLKNIIVSPENEHFIYYENQFLLGKTKKESDEFDDLLFARRDLKEAIIPPFIRRISPYSFENCHQLTSVKFSTNCNLEILCKYSFHSSSIKSFTFPNKVQRIDEHCFESCDQLKNIYFQENSELKIIDKNAFCGSGVESISLPSSVLEIGELSFFNCNSLKKFEIPNDSQLQVIGNEPFANTLIESLLIPTNVFELGLSWCSRVDKLVHISIMPNNPHFLCVDDKFVLGKSDEKSDNYDVLYFARRDIETAVIPSFIKRISSFAFDNCHQLENVVFQPNSKLEIIGDYSFSSADSLQSISIPSSVTEIGTGCFYMCYKLKNVDFQENSKLSKIGSIAFAATSLESFVFPRHVTKIDSVFIFNDSLKRVDFACDSEIKYFNDCMLGRSSIETLTIPPSLSELKEGWCAQVEKLKNIIVIPENEHFIYYENQFLLGKTKKESDEFDDLLFARRDLKEAIIPPFIRRISPYSFENCHQLTNVKFSSKCNLEILCKYSFHSSSIKSFTFPNKVQRIDEHCFESCDQLKNIYFQENSELKIIDKNAFAYTSLDSISFPSSVTIINDRAFMSCNNLKKVEVKENSKLRIIGEDAFGGCSLKSIYIPENVIYIGQNAFYDNSEEFIAEFSENSRYSLCKDKSFNNATSIMIPPKLSKVQFDTEDEDNL